MSFDAVIFDLDGTLIDSEPVFKVVAQRAALDFDVVFSDELFLELVGLPGKEVEIGILDAFGQDFPLAAFRERFGVHWTDHIDTHGIAVKPGAVEFVELLVHHDVPHAVATSTAHDRARRSLELAGLGAHFPLLVGGDEITNGKPAPDIYLHAASRMAVSPRNCIAIEDSKVGVAAAAAAGMYTIMIPDLKQPDDTTRALTSDVLPSLDAAIHRVFELLRR